MKLSDSRKSPQVMILTPVYNEEANLPLYEKTVTEILLSRKDYDFQVLFIDDGSTDRSWPVMQEICARDSRFKGIRLSRHYGSHIALSAGFSCKTGDCLTVLACDLQDPPEVVLKFLERWRAGFQIVWGRRRTRKDRTWRILASNIFYSLVRRFAMPRGSMFTTGSFFLIDNRVAECVRQFPEHNRITFALIAWTGFQQTVVEYDRRRRTAGTSGWTFSMMLKSMYDTFVGFSLLPIRLMTLLGIVVFFFSGLLSVYVLFSWMAGNPSSGWSSLMLVMALFFGTQFLLMALTGEYLYRIYTEVVRRPLYFISEEVGHFQVKEADDTQPVNAGQD